MFVRDNPSAADNQQETLPLLNMQHHSLIGVEASEQDLASDLIGILDTAAEAFPGASQDVLNAFRRELQKSDANVLRLAHELDDYLSALDFSAPLPIRNPVEEVRAIAAALMKE